MKDELLNKDEFENLKDKEKWNYINSLHKMIETLKIKAEKNCEECTNEILSVDDLNISYLFEDWRECSDHCDKCSKEDKVNMCQLQFDILNLLADSLGELRRRQNALTKLVFKRDEAGSKLLKEIEKNRELDKKKAQTLYQ